MWCGTAERNLYVSNLPPTIKSEGLRTFFERFGPVEVSTVRRSYNPSEAAYGFVLFKDVEGAAKALEERCVIDGRRVTVRRCRPTAAPGSGFALTTALPNPITCPAMVVVVPVGVCPVAPHGVLLAGPVHAAPPAVFAPHPVAGPAPLLPLGGGWWTQLA